MYLLSSSLLGEGSLRLSLVVHGVYDWNMGKDKSDVLLCDVTISIEVIPKNQKISIMMYLSKVSPIFSGNNI